MIWMTGALAHTPVLHQVQPDMDWCGFVNGAVQSNGLLFEPGDVALFEPGTYQGGCDFTALPTTESGEVSILQSADTDAPAVFEHDGVDPWILRVTGESFFLVGLRFGTVPTGVTAVLLEDVHDGWLRYPELPSVQGTGVTVRGSCSDLDLLNLRIQGSGLGVDVDCTGDVDLAESWLTLDDAATIVATEARVFDNTFEGRLQLQADTVLERNLFVDVDTALTFTEGDLTMRSNIVQADQVGSFATDGELRILGNTFLAPLHVPDTAQVHANALATDIGHADNVICGEDCYTDAAQLDLYPPADSPLRMLQALPASVGLDFCKQERKQPVAGALTDDPEPPGPIPIGFKSDLPCTFADLPRRETPEPRQDEPTSSGCATAPTLPFSLSSLPLLRI